MFSRLFDSISFPLIAFMFFIYVTYIYFSNKRYNSYANKTYRVLLILTITTTLSLFFDFFGTDGIVGFKGLQWLFARAYILSTMLWAATYSYYLLISFMIKDVTPKKLRTIKIIIYSFNIILFIVSCFLELEFHHRTIYAIGGKALIPLYVEFAVTGIIYLLCPIIWHKKMNKTQLLMHIMILIILITMTLFRFFTSWDVNYFTYIMCIIPIALYFSSESSAYQLGRELEESNKNIEKTIIEQNNNINKLSMQIHEPLSNIYCSQDIINNSQLSDVDFNNEKIKIYNETRKIYDLIIETSKSESEVQK